MTENEYLASKQEIEKKYKELKDKEISELKEKYVTENLKYKKGDIIEDHYNKIKIQRIRIIKSLFKDAPEPLFEGIELKKNNIPKKRQNNTTMYGSNIKGGWKKEECCYGY